MTTGSRTAVGVDVGGTKVNALLVDEGGRVLARAIVPTPAGDMAATVAALVEAARAVLPGATAVGVGAAGLVALGSGHLLSAPNIAWRDVPLKEVVEQATGLPVEVDNDCTVAAYGEWRVGAATGIRDVLYVGVGTGIGGGLVLDGRLYRGAHGYAGEIGHLVVEPEGLPCGCGNRGCWETVASGAAIARDGRRAATRHAHSLLAELAGGIPDAVTGDMVSEAAAQGDPTALGILAEVGARLGQGIAGLANVLDPSLVVVGGGASASGEPLLAPTRHAYHAAVEGRGERPDVPIVVAALGPDGAAIGAALRALDAVGPR